MVAVPGLLAAGLDLPLALGATTATVVVLAFLPVWWGAMARYRWAAPLMFLLLAALPAGLLLAARGAARQDRGWDPQLSLETGLLLVTSFGAIGFLLWARTVIPLHHVALLWGTGMLVGGLMDAGSSLNAWKYELSLPVTVLVLALLHRRHPLVAAGALVGLAAVGATNESRSYAAFCLLSATVVLWGARPSGRGGRPAAVVLIGVAAAAVYELGTHLLVRGYLGETLQERSVAQIREAGSLIEGGRPEWSATVRLFAESPLGFGLGAVPSAGDVRTAKEGLATVGIESSNGYVDNYMFGDQFKLHSVVADLWSSLGLVGVALALALVVLVLDSVIRSVAHGRTPPVVVFVSLFALWMLAFGPIRSNLMDVALAVGLALPMRTGTGTDTGSR